MEKKKDSRATQPIVLILCSSVSTCIDTAARCKELLYNHKTIKSFAGFNGVTDKFLMVNFNKKCGINKTYRLY